MKHLPVIALVGPTCTGKTHLSIHLARKRGGEIIACDSRTTYKYFDIGTAKPSLAERSAVPHHLLDIIEPDESFTAAQFAALGAKAIADIVSRNKIPVVCGGTGFYARALLEGLSIPPIPPQIELRKELEELANKEGNFVLHERLKKLDPLTANRLNVNDRFRVIRALEVCLVTSQPFSTLATKSPSSYNVLWIGLSVSDPQLHKKLIEDRLQEQITAGLVAEVEQLFKRYGSHQKLLNTVTYHDLVYYLQGKLTLQQALDECVRHSYQLVRKQMMWFKTNKKINWFAIDKLTKQDLESSVDAIVNNFLASL